MIALKSLKYFIYDICLSKLFEGIENNLFKKPKLYPGKKFNRVIVSLNEKTFPSYKEAIFTGVTITAIWGSVVEILFNDGIFFKRHNSESESATPEKKATLLISSCTFEE